MRIGDNRRNCCVGCHPIICGALSDDITHKPKTTFGTAEADVVTDKEFPPRGKNLQDLVSPEAASEARVF
jgi:hypothetical protein